MEYYKHLRALVRHCAAQWLCGCHEGRGFAPTRQLGGAVQCEVGTFCWCFLWLLWFTCSFGKLGTPNRAEGVNVCNPEWNKPA